MSAGRPRLRLLFIRCSGERSFDGSIAKLVTRLSGRIMKAMIRLTQTVPPESALTPSALSISRKRAMAEMTRTGASGYDP